MSTTEDLSVALARLHRLEQTAAECGIELPPELAARRANVMATLAMTLGQLADDLQGHCASSRCAGCCG